jgi:DNA/RNA non-specific endonuclease
MSRKYGDLERLVAANVDEAIASHLVDAWLSDYERSTAAGEDIVTTTVSGCHYLFDITYGRLIAAWKISRGRHADDRDGARMRGHPQSAGPLYHRGHVIPHRLGGGTDINLVSQLGSVNTGAFRRLENEAVKNPGALYFTYWMYAPGSAQKPISVEQGLLVPGQKPDIKTHPN